MTTNELQNILDEIAVNATDKLNSDGYLSSKCVTDMLNERLGYEI